MNALLGLMEQDSLEKSYDGIRRAKKELEYFPAPFPEGDESWKDMFDIKRYNKQVDLYKHGETKKTLYGILRNDIFKNGVKDKMITPFAYCEVNGFVNKNFFADKSRLLHEEDFPVFNPASPRDLLWGEGEKTTRRASELFRNCICTTASGGIQSMEKISEESLSYLRDFRTITMWPDNNNEAKEIFLKVGQQIQDNFPHIEVKIVDLPRALPNDWDLANDPPDGVNVFELYRNATPVNEYDSYENLKRDIALGRWLFNKVNNLYYDRITKDLVSEKVLDTLYLRDENAGSKAHKEINRKKAQIIRGFIFSQSKDELVKHDGAWFVNSRDPISFEPLSADEVAGLKDDPDIQRMLHHLWRMANKDDFLYKHFLSTIAHDRQFPEANRIWTMVFCSWAGWGKTWTWRLFTELNGHKNTQWLEQEDIFDRYRDWIPTCDTVIIDELMYDPRTMNKFVSKMKTLVTGERHKFESKYKSKVEFFGNYKFWMSSNHFIPFDGDEEERRHHIIHIDETKDELLLDVDDPDYYEKLWSLLYSDPKNPSRENINHEFLRKVHAYFMNYEIDYSIFSLTKCPETQAKKDMKERSWSQNHRDLRELYLQREKPFNKKMFSAESVMKKVRELRTGGNNYYRDMFHGLREYEILDWFKEKMKWHKVFGGKVLQLGDDPVRRNYWTPDKSLLKITDLSVLREIYNGADLDPNQKILNFKDKKDDHRDKGIEDVPF